MFWCYIIDKESTHSKVDAPRVLELTCSLWAQPLLWVRQERHFYLRLFLLSRKFSSATIRLPAPAIAQTAVKTAISNSYSVIRTTSPLRCGPPWTLVPRTSRAPSYGFRQSRFIGSGGYHPVMCTLPHGYSCLYNVLRKYPWFQLYYLTKINPSRKQNSC